MLRSAFSYFHDLLYRPTRVLWICLLFALFSLMVNGNLFQLWTLYRDHKRLNQSILKLEQDSVNWKQRLKMAKDPAFIEKQARDRFDLVQKDELVFIFAE